MNNLSALESDPSSSAFLDGLIRRYNMKGIYTEAEVREFIQGGFLMTNDAFVMGELTFLREISFIKEFSI